MVDINYQFNKNISEFLNEYKSRFQQLNNIGNSWKMAYQAKLNRTDIDATMKV